MQLQKGPDVKLGWKPYGSNLLLIFFSALSVTFLNCIKGYRKICVYFILVKQVLCITICLENLRPSKLFLQVLANIIGNTICVRQKKKKGDRFVCCNGTPGWLVLGHLCNIIRSQKWEPDTRQECQILPNDMFFLWNWLNKKYTFPNSNKCICINLRNLFCPKCKLVKAFGKSSWSAASYLSKCKIYLSKKWKRLKSVFVPIAKRWKLLAN